MTREELKYWDLTVEDQDIWFAVARRFHSEYFFASLQPRAEWSDIIDAKCMREAQFNPEKILVGLLMEHPSKWIRVRGGESFLDFLSSTTP